MALQNRISFSITPEELERVRTLSTELLGLLLPKLIILTPEDRKQLPKMGDKTYSFVTKALEYSVSREDLLPRYFDTVEAQMDYSAVSILREFAEPIIRLGQMLDDTMTLSGSEAFMATLSFYHALKGAVKDNIPGAQLIYDELKNRFPGSTPKPVAESVTA